MSIYNTFANKKGCFVFILLLIIKNATINALESGDITILILSQKNEYNAAVAQNLEKNIIGQSNTPPKIYLSHRDFSHIGDWTVLPLLPRILGVNKWLFICNEQTKINLDKLLFTLNNYNSSQVIWVGNALFDHDITIIHHFAFHEDPTKFLYPNIASGFAISATLLKKISEESNKEVEFSIDASHELALFIWDDSKGVPLKHDPNFCIDYKNNCATYIQPFKSCGRPVNIKEIYFAVKTCEKFHDNRIGAVKNTWGKYAENLHYFSDVLDPNIPTISLNIPNTDRGHCQKTFSIIKYAYNEIRNNRNIKWLVITDDDTIISPFRLASLLSCYKTDDLFAIGERYGYRVRNLDQKGYNYLTGGAGTVLSKKLVEKIVENPKKCFCPKIDNPDDMILGVCLARLGVQVIHSPNFHQARPNDYSPEYLSRTDAISFHKHWMVDPVEIYTEWFENDDQTLLNPQKVEL